MLSFKPEDVALILGLRCDGDNVSFKNKSLQSEFEQTFLNKMHNWQHDATKETYSGLYAAKTLKMRHL